MTILAKFKVGSTTDFGNDNLEVKMTPVIAGNGKNENTSFSKYTPTGDIRMHITNPAVLGFFEAGKEYYVEFRKAE